MRVRLLRNVELFGVAHHKSAVITMGKNDFQTDNYIILTRKGSLKFLEKNVDAVVEEVE